MLAYVHNVPILGPPGAGTSMLARRLTTMFPAMTLAEAIETTRIHRVAGLTGDRTALVTTRPFRPASHHFGCRANRRRPHTERRLQVCCQGGVYSGVQTTGVYRFNPHV
jgi:Magnesium chelatase, subunit ChlI